MLWAEGEPVQPAEARRAPGLLEDGPGAELPTRRGASGGREVCPRPEHTPPFPAALGSRDLSVGFRELCLHGLPQLPQ